MSNDLTTTSGNVPAHLQATGNSGFMEDDQSLMSPPRMKLIQKTSKEFDEGLAKAGDFFNTATSEAMEEILFTPIKGHLEYVQFDDEGQVAFRTDSEAEARQTLGEDYWRAKRMNILILPYASETPAVYTFSGSSFKTGTKLYQLAKTANPNCIFSKAYRLTSKEMSGAGGKYYTANVSLAKDIEGYSDPSGWLTEEAFNVARVVAEQV